MTQDTSGKLLFVTGNQNKLEEARKIIGNGLASAKIDLQEIQGTAEEIVQEKARTAFEILKKPLFVEDTGLVFEALGELPGPYIKSFLKNVDLLRLHNIALLDGVGRARAECYVAYADSGGINIFKGVCNGKIVLPKGSTDFGWDPIFQPDGFTDTFATMGDAKNKISHRGKAFAKLIDFLKDKNIL